MGDLISGVGYLRKLKVFQNLNVGFLPESLKM
jgi:hypothetical protein